MIRRVIFVLLAAAAVACEALMASRRPGASPALGESAFAALGGLRSIAAEIVWFRADRLQDEGRFVELAQLARTLAMMEPHTPEVWSYAAWNLAYNVSVMMPTPDDRWRWVRAALSLLRDDGLRLNPASAELHRELAWLFQLKFGTNLDSAASAYRRHWRETVADVASRNAWGELGMDPALMAEVESRFGVDDRGDPQYSAIYWAYRGLPHATGSDRSFLAEIIRQAKVIYDKGEFRR